MKNSFFLHLAFILGLAFLLSSCVYNKASYLNSFKDFVEKVENMDSMTDTDFDAIDREFSEYTEKYYDQYKEDLTREDKEEIVFLKARYYQALARHGVKNLGEKLDELGEEALDFINDILK